MAKGKQKPRDQRPEKRPEMRAFLACEGATRDADQGKTSLYAIFDLVWAEDFPALFKPFCLFAKLVGGSGKHKVAIQGFGTDGRLFGKHEPTKASFGSDGAADIVIQIGMIPLHGPGTIKFTLSVDGKQVGWACEITVKKRSPTKEKK